MSIRLPYGREIWTSEKVAYLPPGMRSQYALIRMATQRGRVLPEEQLARLPERVRLEYAWLRPLGLDVSSFPCDPAVIWEEAYSFNRQDGTAEQVITVEDVRRFLDEFFRVKLLFRWIQADGGEPIEYRADLAARSPADVWGMWTEDALDSPSGERVCAPGPTRPRARRRGLLRGGKIERQ